MPFALYHLGPALFFAAALSPLIVFPVFIAASLLPDVEGALWLAGLNGQPHGLMHSYFGATVFALLLGFLAFRYHDALSRFDPFPARHALKAYLFSSLTGAWLHVFVDSLVYADQDPFLPFNGNPLAGFASYDAVAVACVLFGLAGLALYYAEKS